MAQQRTRPQGTGPNARSQSEISATSDMDSHDESTLSRPSRPTRSQGSQQARGPQQRRTGQLQQSQGQQTGGQKNELLEAVTPAFQEARRYIEGSPIAAAAIGAIAGGLLMTLISTEKGRSFAKAAYDYANPMVAKYARDYIAQAAGNMTEQALSQH
jgi:hypothetical protein